MTANSTAQLRERFVSLRKNLSAIKIKNSAEQLKHYVETFLCFKNATTVATYLAINGEADPCGIVDSARSLGKTVLLPVIKGETLLFAPFSSNSNLVTGQYNIPIPEHTENELLNPRDLDLVIVPLVAFDNNLNRVGMGGGFYDKTFAFRRNNSACPQLVGIAHDLQRTKKIESQPWDVPMDFIVTEKAVYGKLET